MSSVFERLQKIAEEKRLKDKADKPKLEVVQKTDASLSEENQPIQSNLEPSNSPVSETNQESVAAAKDFQKVPNSITRDAIPNKFFKGTSKNTYDALFLRTRGAVNPTRTIKATKRELMQWVGVSDVTLFKHLKHLQESGLLKIEFQPGAHDGSIYEVFIPEELVSDPSNVIQSNVIQSNVIQSNVIQSKKVGWDPSKKVGLDWMGNPLENKGTYEPLKTSLKTNTKNDDEAFADLLDVLRRGSEKVSGKISGKNQKKNWEELAELLVMELEIAAARTKTVSNVPAFLTEHLRRRLLGKPETRKTKTNKLTNKSSESDKSKSGEEIEAYQPEPLTEQGRKSTLKTFNGYIEKGQKEFLMNLSDTYTNEDWEWLLKNLQK